MSFKFYNHVPSYDTAQVFYVRLAPNISLLDELLKSLCYALWFPGYFGFNWDALFECLRDFDWIPYKTIVLVHSDLPNLSDRDLKIYLEILRDSVLDWDGDNDHELEVFFRTSDRSKVVELLSK